MRPSRPIAWLLILAAGLLAGSCGRKTRPVPPQSVVPARITDLRSVANDTGVTLTWSWPDRTEQGGSLKTLSHFLVEKAEYRVDEFCPECPVRYDKAARIDGGALPADAKSRQLSYRDQDLKAGHYYSFRVFSSMGWNVVSLPSEPVSLIWQTPLASPADLKARAGDGEIHVSWQEVSSDIDNRSVMETIRYRVYRSSGQEPPAPIGNPVSAPAYHDRRVTNGTVYRYQVMAFRAEGSGGRLSETVEAKPSDMTPPPAPRGLKAIRTSDGGVSLFWDQVSAEDLAGYMVLRRNTYRVPKPGHKPEKEEESETDLQEIGSVTSPATRFTDQTPPVTAGAWHYAVRSFDTADPPNLSPLSWEIKILREK